MNKVTLFKLETAKLYVEKINNNSCVNEAIEFAEAAFEDIEGDIETETPQDCIDGEIDAMRSY